MSVSLFNTFKESPKIAEKSILGEGCTLWILAIGSRYRIECGIGTWDNPLYILCADYTFLYKIVPCPQFHKIAQETRKNRLQGDFCKKLNLLTKLENMRMRNKNEHSKDVRKKISTTIVEPFKPSFEVG